MTATGRETQTSAAFPYSFVTVGTEAKTRAQMDSTGAGAQGSPRHADSVGAGAPGSPRQKDSIGAGAQDSLRQTDSVGAGAQGSLRQIDSVGAGVEVTTQGPHVPQSSFEFGQHTTMNLLRTLCYELRQTQNSQSG